MKHKDLKTGVVYRKTTGSVKAVIITLDQNYEKPNAIIKGGGKCIVREGKGASKGYLVLQASHIYPDDLLIEAANRLAHSNLPIIGEVWPYAVEGGRKTEPVGEEKLFHHYPPLNTPPAVVGGRTLKNPQVSVWMGTQIAGEYGKWLRAQREAEQAREEVIAAAKKLIQKDAAESQELLDRFKELKITGVQKNVIAPVRWRGIGGVHMSNEMFEALIKRAS